MALQYFIFFKINWLSCLRIFLLALFLRGLKGRSIISSDTIPQGLKWSSYNDYNLFLISLKHYIYRCARISFVLYYLEISKNSFATFSLLTIHCFINKGE
jgi:hypothetical protein